MAERINQKPLFLVDGTSRSRKREKKSRRRALSIEEQVKRINQMQDSPERAQIRRHWQEIVTRHSSYFGKGLEVILTDGVRKGENVITRHVDLKNHEPERDVLTELVKQIYEFLDHLQHHPNGFYVESPGNAQGDFVHHWLVKYAIELDASENTTKGNARSNVGKLIRALYRAEFLNDTSGLDSIRAQRGNGHPHELLNKILDLKVGSRQSRVDFYTFIESLRLTRVDEPAYHPYVGRKITPSSYTIYRRHISPDGDELIIRESDPENATLITAEQLIGTAIHRTVQQIHGSYFDSAINNNFVLHDRGEEIPLSTLTLDIFGYERLTDKAFEILQPPTDTLLTEWFTRPQDVVNIDELLPIIKEKLSQDDEIVDVNEATKLAISAFAHFAHILEDMWRDINIRASLKVKDEKQAEKARQEFEAMEALLVLLKEKRYYLFIQPVINAVKLIIKGESINLENVGWRIFQEQGTIVAMPKIMSEMPMQSRVLFPLQKESQLHRRGFKYTQFYLETVPDLVIYNQDGSYEIHDYKFRISASDIVEIVAFLYAINVAIHGEHYHLPHRSGKRKVISGRQVVIGSKDGPWFQDSEFLAIVERLKKITVTFQAIGEDNTPLNVKFDEDSIFRHLERLQFDAEVNIHYEEFLKGTYSQLVSKEG